MKKQGRRGEGTIYREESGRWHGQLLLPNGKRKSVYGATQREVQRKLAEIKREVEAGLHTTTSSDHTLRQYTDNYLLHRASILRPRTYHGYLSLTRNHLGKGSIGDKALAKITPQDIHNLYATKLQAGLSSTTVGHLHAMLRVILKSAVKLGIIPRNPTEFVDAPPLKPKEIAPLSESQVKVFLQAIKGHPLESLFVTILGTGMRMGEFLGLQWTEVDILQKRLRVRTTLHRYDGVYTLETTKARKSRRELPLSAQVLAALGHRYEQQDVQCMEAGDAWNPDWNLVFCTDIGTPISPDHIRYTFRRVIKAAKLPVQTRVHDLRHTFATLLLERGVNVRVVSELLGHSSVAITLAIYGHVTPKMQDTALEHITHILDEETS